MKRIIPGVSVILERVDGKTLIVQETEKKPWKDPGDFSIPMETKKEEETLKETIERAIFEEANGIKEYEIGEEIGEYNILDMALVRCFIVKVTKYKNPLTGNEVNNHQWLLPEQALDLKLRVGAKEMITDFLQLKDKP